MTPIHCCIPIHSDYPHGLHFRAAKLEPEPGNPCFAGCVGRTSGRYGEARDGLHRLEDGAEVALEDLYLDLRDPVGRRVCAGWLENPTAAALLEGDAPHLGALAHLLYLRKCNGVLGRLRNEIAPATVVKDEPYYQGVIANHGACLTGIVGYVYAPSQRG